MRYKGFQICCQKFLRAKFDSNRRDIATSNYAKICTTRYVSTKSAAFLTGKSRAPAT